MNLHYIIDVDMMIYSGIGLPVNLHKYYRTSFVTPYHEPDTQNPELGEDLAGPVNHHGIIRMLRSDPSVAKRDFDESDDDMGMIRMLRSNPSIHKRSDEMGSIRMLRSNPSIYKRSDEFGRIRMLRSDPNFVKRNAEMGRIRMLRSAPVSSKRSEILNEAMGRIRML